MIIRNKLRSFRTVLSFFRWILDNFKHFVLKDLRLTGGLEAVEEGTPLLPFLAALTRCVLCYNSHLYFAGRLITTSLEFCASQSRIP